MINTTQISNLLRPGLKSVFGSYDMYPSQWKDIFKSYDSDKAVEIDVEMKMLGLGQVRAEGAATVMDDMSQRVVTNYIHKYVGLGFVITRQAMMDNLYQSNFPQMTTSLKNSLAQTKEMLAASVLNNGFNPAYPVGDGVQLFATNHPIDGGTFSNTQSIPADLNEGSLESALIAIQQFKDQAGLICMNKPLKLIVPPQLQYTANRILKSEFRTNTTNNDVSAVYNLNAVPEGYRVNQFLTAPKKWFLLTDASNGFKHFVREKIDVDMYTDFSTDSLMVKAVERYSFGVSNVRAAFGGGT